MDFNFMSTLTYQLPNRKNNLVIQIIAALIGGLVLFLVILIVWILSYQLIYAGRVFPGVSVAGIDLSGLSVNDAAVKLNQTLSFPISGKVLFRYGDSAWVVSPVQLGVVFDASASARAAYEIGRSNGLFGSLAEQVRARGIGTDASPVIVFDQRLAYAYLQSLASEIDQPVVEAGLQLDGTNVVATPGQIGRRLNLDATLIYLGAQLQTFTNVEVPLVIQEIQPTAMDVSVQAETARAILSQPLTLQLPNAQSGDPGPWTYDVEVLAKMLKVQSIDTAGKRQVQVVLDPQALRDALALIRPFVDRDPVNARFYFDDATLQLVSLEAARIGRSLNVDATIQLVNDSIIRGEHTIQLQIVETQPAVNDSVTAQELGITQLVGENTSYFNGSSNERIQNIQTAASRFHGVLIAPGETFSMSSMMGDVSLENGFAEALIIYGGRTIKGVGGGVCQVSTTLFRTVFFAGFPINERYNHAYRVSYYEQTAGGNVDRNLAGLDATVYFPLVDFKFTNDLPYWLLMETYVSVDGRSLTWKLYSTSDGRSVSWETTGPLNVVTAPDPLFEVNEDLESNEIKQVDWAANGADVTVTRTVTRDGVVYFSDEYRTQYEPWQAICQYGPGTDDPESIARRKGLCNKPPT